MKQKFNKIGAVLMIIVVLFSTISFTIHKQYCSGYLMDTALFSTSDACKLIKNNDCCEIVEDCCDLQQIVVEGQTEFLFNKVASSSSKKQQFVVNSLKLFFDDFEIYAQSIFQKKEYSPPNLVIINRQVIYQTFLI